MKNVAIEDLHVGNDKIGFAIDDDASSIVFLSTTFGIEIGFIQDDTERCVGGQLRRRVIEFAGRIDRFDGRVDISKTYESYER